jgi:hypothetical protein
LFSNKILSQYKQTQQQQSTKLMGLGIKISKGINRLGRKVENASNKLGQKTSNVFKKLDKGINNVDNYVGDAIDKGANIAQQVIKKSGGFTNALKQGAMIIGDTIVSNLNRAGLADVPGIGIASKLAETGTNALRKGAVKLDSKRDTSKLANQIENARQTAQIEKSNVRKRVEAEKENAQNKITNFV